MATPVLNNGIFLRDTEYALASNQVTAAHLMTMLGDPSPTDLGVVDIWAAQQKIEMPLYSMANFGGKNVISVDSPNGDYKWTMPIVNDLPFIVEDMDPGNTTKGIDGQSFRIKLSRRDFGHGAIISYDKYSGTEMYITGDDIQPTGDGAIYTVRLVNNDTTRFLDNAFLEANTPIFRKGSAKGEFSQKYDDVVTRSGFREFYNFVGNASAHVSYHVTTRADQMIKLGARTAKGTIPVMEMWQYDGSLDPSITSLEDMLKALGPNKAKKAIAEGKLSANFLTKLEANCIRKIANDIETYLMWGLGGHITDDGLDDSRLTTGLWTQMNNSFMLIYTKPAFSLDMFTSQIYNFFAGKEDMNFPDSNRKIIVQSGRGGMQMVSLAIAAKGLGSGLVINATEIGAITGKGLSLGWITPTFDRYSIPGIANIVFEYNPAFDNFHTNTIENPLIDGFPLSSYSFIIYDVTDNTNDNIFLLKRSEDHALRWWYENGTADFMGRKSGFMSVGKFSGYKVYMEQLHQAIWVKDPTKLLKIVMKNPVTGGHL
jgi:hypothetical protein